MQPKLSAMLTNCPISQIEPSPRPAVENLHRKAISRFFVRSLTPLQAAGIALASAVQHLIIIDLMDKLLRPKGRPTSNGSWCNPSGATRPKLRRAERLQATVDLKA